ncbi:hypothetical protein [Haladaptatus sp. DFWS20]|uniref:hypothetical protein n=1 Tax=Haladaptatus sp. DFWS20 TaxID=3403467 RepID=UPI003EBD58D5
MSPDSPSGEIVNRTVAESTSPVRTYRSRTSRTAREFAGASSVAPRAWGVMAVLASVGSNSMPNVENVTLGTITSPTAF